MADALTAGPDRRPLDRLVRWAALAAGILICLLPIVWALNPSGLVRRNILIDQFLSLELGLALAFVLFDMALRAKRDATWIACVVLGIAALAVTAWLEWHFATANLIAFRPTLVLVIASVLLIALCLIATWDNGYGRDMVLLIAAFLIFGYVAQFLPAWIGSAPVRPDGYITYMIFGSNGLLGQALQIIVISVIVYVVFGFLFEVSGGSNAVAALALYFARHGRGAAIKVCIVASGLFGMITGSATSNVLTAGSFSIPGMKKMGVPAATAGGIEAVASTCGQIMPPVMGASAFLMANLTGISYAHIALAAFVPSLLCFVVLFLQAERLGQQIEAKRGRMDRVFDEDAYRLRWSSLIHLVPITGLVAVLLRWPTLPELAGIAGIVLAAGVAVITRGAGGAWRALVDVLPKAGRTVANLVVAASTIGIILAVIGSTGLDVHITIAISELGRSNLFVSLALTAIAAFVLGLGISTAGVYIVAGSLLAPGLIQLGVPVIAAHFFVLFSAMLSMITPPVAFASLAASGLAGAGFNETSNEAMKFGWILFLLPFLIAYSPELVLVGDAWDVIGAIASATAGVLVVGNSVYAGLGDPRRSPLPWLKFLAGMLLILPVLPIALRSLLAAIAIVVIASLWISAMRRARAAG